MIGCAGARPADAPVLAVKSPHAPSVRGHVRVQAGRNGWTVNAALGHIPSYVSQTFTGNSHVTIAFCLDVPSGIDAKIIELQPGGISILVHHGKLVLHVDPGRQTYSARRKRDVAGRRTLVRLTIDGTPASLVLTAAGVRQVAFRAPALKPHAVKIGSLTPVAKPSPPATQPPQVPHRARP